MDRLARGTRVGYRQQRQIRHGVIVAVEPNEPFSNIVYLVKNDASGR